ncbi:MAG: acetyl-CoA carboxylase biotin carboxyl carrier protein [Tepidisphaera sp.]|jgi:acetyl-CoA carboxylase biotin carboxyl carrier protein
MIDASMLKELVRLMVDNDLSELDLRDANEKVTIRRGPQGVTYAPAPVMHAAPAMAAAPAAAPAAGGAPAPAAANDDAGLIAIESPMVGTFYAAPNPDAGAFVKVGSAVTNDTVVCMVEAMKVFNEIKSGKAGKIERILVKNGEAVEFGQKLFLVRP